jgi:hypothetical protein|tara:strand:- start:225 stop:416 length:192 start_codon:yes stop_codon:yes gene_type:complete
MYCIVWKREGSDLHEMFTNQIFETEKKAIEFKNKQKSMRKKHDCRVLEYEYKYFDGVKLDGDR